MHIGPLIGSKTDKGPCQKNSTHLHDTTALNQIQVKTENPSKSGKLEVMVKPEIIDTHTQYDTIDGARKDRSYENIALVPQHHPSYTLNPKLLEQPEMSVSPARGSIGPGIPKIQAGATQPIDIGVDNQSANTMNNLLTQTQTPVLNRRARVGKNMAREMMLQSRANAIDSANEMELNIQDSDALNQTKSTNMCTSTPIKEQIHHDEYETNELNTLPHFMSASNPINGKLIKAEDVKKECDDDILTISDKSETETIPSDTEKSDGAIQIIDLSYENGGKKLTGDNDESHLGQSLKRRNDTDSNASEIIDLDEDVSVTAVKRRKIMEFHKNPNKKSPPNSYKNLIKPSVKTKSYLCRAENQSKDKDLVTSKSSASDSADELSVVLPDEAEKSMANGNHESHDLRTVNVWDVNNTANEPIAMETNENRNEMIGKALDTISLTPSIADEFPQELSAEEENLMSHSNSEGISKGYCSDNELLSRKKERLKIKIQKCEGRSRSESKKSDKAATTIPTAKSHKTTAKSRKTSRDRSTSSSKSKEQNEKSTSKKPKLSENGAMEKILSVAETSSTTTTTDFTVASTKKKTDAKAKKEKSKTSKAKKSCDKSKKTVPDNSRPKKSDTDIEIEVNTDADDELLDNESRHNNNNNSILFDRNTLSVSMNKSTSAKKPKSRGSKFSNKKRHRQRHPKHIEEVFVPRQTLSAPRWSNGWMWQGEPFQGKIFLNVSCAIENILFCHFRNDIWFTLFYRAMIIKWFVHDIQPCDTIAAILFGPVTVYCCVHAARKMNFRMWQKWHHYGKIQKMVCISFISLFFSFCSVDFTQSKCFLFEI